MDWREKVDTTVGAIAGGGGFAMGVVIIALLLLGFVKLIELMGGI